MMKLPPHCSAGHMHASHIHGASGPGGLLSGMLSGGLGIGDSSAGRIGGGSRPGHTHGHSSEAGIGEIIDISGILESGSGIIPRRLLDRHKMRRNLDRHKRRLGNDRPSRRLQDLDGNGVSDSKQEIDDAWCLLFPASVMCGGGGGGGGASSPGGGSDSAGGGSRGGSAEGMLSGLMSGLLGDSSASAGSHGHGDSMGMGGLSGLLDSSAGGSHMHGPGPAPGSAGGPGCGICPVGGFMDAQGLAALEAAQAEALKLEAAIEASKLSEAELLKAETGTYIPSVNFAVMIVFLVGFSIAMVYCGWKFMKIREENKRYGSKNEESIEELEDDIFYGNDAGNEDLMDARPAYASLEPATVAPVNAAEMNADVLLTASPKAAVRKPSFL